MHQMTWDNFGNLGEELKTRRAKEGMSQQQCAEWLNVSQTDISHVESGKLYTPSKLMMARILDYLGYRLLVEYKPNGAQVVYARVKQNQVTNDLQ